MIADTDLEQAWSAEDFGREGAEGINVIPPACRSQRKDITTLDGAFTRLASYTNCDFIRH